MIKADLVRAISKEFELSGNLSAKIVQTLLNEMVSGLIADSKIELRGFGVFGIKRQAPRVITLPSGKKVKRPARNVVLFTPSETLKRTLNPRLRTNRKS